MFKLLNARVIYNIFNWKGKLKSNPLQICRVPIIDLINIIVNSLYEEEFDRCQMYRKDDANAVNLVLCKFATAHVFTMLFHSSRAQPNNYKFNSFIMRSFVNHKEKINGV